MTVAADVRFPVPIVASDLGGLAHPEAAHPARRGGPTPPAIVHGESHRVTRESSLVASIACDAWGLRVVASLEQAHDVDVPKGAPGRARYPSGG